MSGVYDGYKMNFNGTFVRGGVYDGCVLGCNSVVYKMNSNGTHVLDGACDRCKMDPNGTFILGGN